MILLWVSVKSLHLKITPGRKYLHRHSLCCLWQISGMHRFTSKSTRADIRICTIIFAQYTEKSIYTSNACETTLSWKIHLKMYYLGKYVWNIIIILAPYIIVVSVTADVRSGSEAPFLPSRTNSPRATYFIIILLSLIFIFSFCQASYFIIILLHILS